MRKSILFMFFAGIVTIANAQSNSILLFGNFSAGTNTSKDTDSYKSVSTTFTFNPAIGYQVSRYWTLGIEGTVNYTEERNSYTGPYNISNNNSHRMADGGGVFARYTLPITNIIFFYGQADGVYTTSKAYDNGVSDPFSVVNTFYIRLTPSLGFNIKNGYALTAGFGGITYNKSKYPSDGTTNSAINTNFGQAFIIGFSKNFARHNTGMNKNPVNAG